MIEKVAIKIKDHITKLLTEIDLLTKCNSHGWWISNSSIVYDKIKKLVSDKVPLDVQKYTDLVGFRM